MGKPVVASRFPIIEELVKHGETGLLVPPGEPETLADAMLELLQDPERSARFGKLAHALARSRYDSTLSIRGIVEIYDRLLRLPMASTVHPVREEQPGQMLIPGNDISGGEGTTE